MTGRCREMPPAGQSDWAKHKDTVYLCVVDEEGNACSFINSLFESFGTGILAEKSGVMLHNRGFGFRLQEGHANCIAPNKRPMHTIIPGMVMKDGEAIMPYGVMGGHFQPMGQTLFLTNHFEFGLDVQEAIDCPRLFPAPGGKGAVEVERGIPASVIDRLARLGHEVELVDKPHGGGQAIFIDRKAGTLIGGSDPRKDGSRSASERRCRWRAAGRHHHAGCRRHRQCRRMPRCAAAVASMARSIARPGPNCSRPAWRSAAARPGRRGSPRASGCGPGT